MWNTFLAKQRLIFTSSTQRIDMLAFRLHPDDNVVVATTDISHGVIVHGEDVVCKETIPRAHKMATVVIKKGQAIRKYQQIIGFASCDIDAGEHVHVHNCEMGDFDRDYAFCEGAKAQSVLPPAQQRTFMGYQRANGKSGTRNYIGVLTSVNCSATAAKMIADTINQSAILDQFPNVDGVVSFVHGTGCCMGSTDADEGYRHLKRVLQGYAVHPNFGGVLMIGLGCESMQISAVMEHAGLSHNDTFQTLTIQASGGTRKTVEAGVAAITTMLPTANQCQREPISVSELTVALECGGSDGYSGITANPALGAAVDLLVEHGGTGILSETPEIYGAEHLLTRRAVDRDVGQQLVERIKWWEDYTERNNGKMDNNPTPGNKAGGLTTILEKSLGAQAKGGSTNLMGVYRYAQLVDQKGFVFMDSPGFDPASITGMVASGANVICFTTGRGSAFGYKPSPSIKLATNTGLFERMHEDMDINCGTIIDGEATVQEKGLEIFEKIIAIASGQQSKSELLGYGDNEFTPWQIGAVM
jgi:arabinonate dehydratase